MNADPTGAIMRCFRTLCRFLAVPLSVVILLETVPAGIVHAGLVKTEDVLQKEKKQSVKDDRAKLKAFLDREDVREQLQAFGVDPDEASTRVANLSDDEIEGISGQIATLPAGEGAAEAVIIAALALFLLVVVLDLLGVTNVFPFIKAQR